MSKYAHKQFWIDAADRAVATFAQGALGAITADTIGVTDLDLGAIASIGGLAALVSILTSVAFRGGADTLTPDEAALIRDIRQVEGRDTSGRRHDDA